VVVGVGGGPDWALLGETEKFVPVSRQRVVDVVAGPTQVRVRVVGAVAEVVTFRIALIATSERGKGSFTTHVVGDSGGSDERGGSNDKDGGATAPRVVQQTVALGRDGRGTFTFNIN
jgi:hypothetical protein